MRIRHFWRTALALGLGAMPAAACADQLTAPGEAGGIPANLAPGIYPLVAVASGTGDAAQVDLYLKRVGSSPRVAAYQGEVTYDTRVLTLDHTDLPAGIVGATSESQPGHVRFAGAALDGIADAPVVTLRFTRHGAIARESFGLRFEEVTGLEGFADLTPQLVADRPLFTQSR